MIRTSNPIDRSVPRLLAWGIVYFSVLWRILPYLANLRPDSTSQINLAVLFISTEVVMFLPFFLKEINGHRIGLVHPLTTPYLVAIATSFIREPMLMVAPSEIFYGGQAHWRDFHFLAAQLSESELASSEAKQLTCILFAQSCLIFGFLLFLGRKFSAQPPPQRNTAGGRLMLWRLGFIAVLMFTVFATWMVTSGGIAEHFASLAYGRAAATQEAGVLIAVVRLIPLLFVFWAASDHRAFTNPLFIGGIVISILASFLSSGSRSEIFVTLAYLLIVRWIKIGKPPGISAVAGAVLAIALLGVLGDLRQSAARNSGVTDFSVLSSNLDFNELIEKSRESAQASANVRGDIAVFIKVPSQSSYLLGETYVGSIAFFIPRAIWPEKPRSSGAYVGAILYQGMTSARSYTGAGFPTGAQAEAYWNFGLGGVCLIFVAFGVFLSALWKKIAERPQEPFFIVLGCVLILSFNAPSSENFPTFIRSVLFLWALNIFVIHRHNKKRIPRRIYAR